MKACLLIILSCTLLGACSSASKKQRSDFGPTYRERLAEADKAMKKSDFSKRSTFEKQLTDATTTKKFKTSDYHAKDVKIDKKFHGTDEAFKTKGFAQADKTSKTSAFHDADTKSRLAGGLFHTKNSRMADEKSRDATKSFAGGKNEFATRENRAGKKALDKDSKPKILDPDKPTYTEDEVRRLLNKGT